MEQISLTNIKKNLQTLHMFQTVKFLILNEQLLINMLYQDQFKKKILI